MDKILMHFSSDGEKIKIFGPKNVELVRKKFGIEIPARKIF